MLSMFLAVIVQTIHTLEKHHVQFYVWFRDIAVCSFVLLLNGLEDILKNVRLKFKYIIFSGNHDNHAWSSSAMSRCGQSHE